jgi:class 3 adenylate cyclase
MKERDNLKAGERRVATILFSDMKGFTSLSERTDPEEMDALMTKIFGSFEEIIRTHGGIVEKYIGDALVAVFGVPELHEDDPSRAVHAALEFQARMRAEAAKAPGAPSFRTGIHAGLVTTGKRGEFDVVTGHAMSVAQRLESAAMPGSILVSEAAKEKCGPDFEFSGPLKVEAKGKSEPIVAYEVKGESSGALRDTGPFVGRRELLDEMLKAYVRDRHDEVSGYYLSGEGGIGKTRLAQALIDKIRLFPDFKTPVLAARAQKYRPGGFAVIVDIVLGYLGLEPGAEWGVVDREAAKLRAVSEMARKRFVDLACCRDWDKPEQSSITVLYDIFETILERHAQDLFPILVCVDNANFMDRLSREFFQYLFKNGTVKPFFMLTGREFSPELREVFQGVKTVKLQGLGPEEAEALVRAHWPDPPPEALARILEAGMGNPLFLREYAAYAAKHRDASALPATVQNIFLTGLERYPPEWRDLAKRLSVFVHSFTEDDARRMQEAAGAEISAVAKAVESFAKDGLLVRSGEGWAFRADVYKKALYSSLLNHNKRVLHGIAADILASGDRPHRIRLIHHLARAERYAEAARVIQDDPSPTYNYEFLPYIDLLYRRLGEDEKTRVRLLMTKAAILFNRGRVEESEAVLLRIMRIAIARKDPGLMGYAYHHVCAYNAMTYAFQKAIFTGQKALYYYRRSDVRPRSVQNLLKTIAQAHAMRNDLDEARRLVSQCEAMPGGDPHEAAEARAEFHLLAGDYDKALTAAQRSLDSMPEDRAPSRFFALDYAVKALWQLCDFEGVRLNASLLLEQGRLSECSMSQANAMLAFASLLAGERDAARDRFVQAEFYAAQIRNVFDKVEALRSLSLSRYLAGDARKAESTALEALTLGLRHSCYWPTFALLVLLAEASYARGKAERARFFLVEASYFFTMGLLLPSKDLLLYYWLASKLLDPAASSRNQAVAIRLLQEEKAKIGKELLVANFLSIRSYGTIQRELEGVGGEDPRGLS